ncbi:MAG: hypothetical protein NTZ65_00010 [Candidatus Berkelbacteria bacterium]|nr:hypothetical protein [Candidatus Berkelbacteria bacterium]
MSEQSVVMARWFQILTEDEAKSYALAIMGNILVDKRLIAYIVEADLLPPLCSLLRRALGMSRADLTSNTDLVKEMSRCHQYAFDFCSCGGSSGSTEPHFERNFTGQVLRFSYKVVARYRAICAKQDQ